jgi:uncharacterized SAM-binding protein YcdF (DUF218 family)
VIFAASKILWVVAAPGNLLLLLLLFGVGRFVISRGRRGSGAVLLATLSMLITAALPVAAWLAAPLENRFPTVVTPPDRVDGIILLGGAVEPRLSKERGQVSLNDAAERVTETVALARRYPQARVLITGGDASLVPKDFSEAEPTRDLLIALGVEPERLVIEGASRNTWENAVLSYGLAQPRADETWLLVTTAMHMPRSVGCFRRAGWSVLPYPVDYRTRPSVAFVASFAFPAGLGMLNLVVQEWDGLIAYYLLDRMDALFPGP